MFSKFDVSISNMSYDPPFLSEDSSEGYVVVSLQIECGNSKRICDVCANVEFSFDSHSVGFYIDLGYFDDSNEEDLANDNKYLSKIFASLNDEFKAHILNLIIRPV